MTIWHACVRLWAAAAVCPPQPPLPSRAPPPPSHVFCWCWRRYYCSISTMAFLQYYFRDAVCTPCGSNYVPLNIRLARFSRPPPPQPPRHRLPRVSAPIPRAHSALTPQHTAATHRSLTERPCTSPLLQQRAGLRGGPGRLGTHQDRRRHPGHRVHRHHRPGRRRARSLPRG